MKLTADKKRAQRGQVMTEYAIALIMFALLAVVSLTLTHYFSLFGGRMVDFVCIEYP